MTSFAEAWKQLETKAVLSLVDTDLLPSQLDGCTEDEVAALGVVLGGPDRIYPELRHALLPEGWRRELSGDPDEHRVIHLVDADGRRRASAFFKIGLGCVQTAYLALSTVEPAGGCAASVAEDSP